MEREDLVGWSVSAGLGAERGGPGDRLFFERGVGVLVDVRGLGALMPEPLGVSSVIADDLEFRLAG